MRRRGSPRSAFPASPERMRSGVLPGGTIGVTSGSASPPTGGERSAHLFEYDPGEPRMRDRGDVLSNLRRIDRARPGESQVKIHSRIIFADDGYLYFTSTDEEGEQKDGSAPPRWGSHLWRLRPYGNSDGWEHLLAAPEGLTCAAGIGFWVYALGLWNHVLYRFDTAGGPVRRVVVGSVGGHMSRNLVVDTNGHVYVPRVQRELGTGALHHHPGFGSSQSSKS